MFIPFAEWAPDQDLLSSGSAEYVVNVYPSGDAYHPVKGETVIDSALTNPCLGAHTHAKTNGTVEVFAGDSYKLYKYNGSTDVWDDKSQAGGYTVVRYDDYWEFASWQGKVIATNMHETMQIYDTATALFIDLDAAIPANQLRAALVGVVNEFCVLGHVYDPSTTVVEFSRVHWSAIGDATDWTVSATTQCDYQDLDQHYGTVQKVVSGDVGYIFQERAITRMTYVGSPTIFQFDQVETERGTVSGRSVVRVGDMIYYLAADGFYVFNGSTSQRIGDNKIDKTFWDYVNRQYVHNVVGTYDTERKLVIWSVPFTYGSRTPTAANALFCFSTSEGPYRWSLVWLDTEYIYMTDYDSDTYDTNLQISTFNTSHKATTLTGTYKEAEIETGEYQPAPEGRSLVRRVRPIVSGTGGTITLEIASRDKSNEAFSDSSVYSMNSNGAMSTRDNARYHKARVSITGGFDAAKGVDVEEVTPTGKR